MDMYEKTLKNDVKFKGKILQVEEVEVALPNGKSATREVVKHSGAVCIAAITAENEFIFVKQFRCPFSKVILELPAGRLENGKDDPISDSQRELKEETGAIGVNYVNLGKMYMSPGYSSEEIFLFLCSVKEFGETCPDEDEFLKVVKIPVDKAYSMVLNNEIEDAKTQIGVIKAYNYLLKNRNR